MTQRLKLYADSFAKASRLDFKPEMIVWDQNEMLNVEYVFFQQEIWGNSW